MNVTAAQAMAYMLVLAGALVMPGLVAVYAMRRDFIQRQANPALIEGLERSMVSSQQRMDAIERARDDDRAQVAQMRLELARVGIRLERWMAYAQLLVNILRENDMAVPPSPDEMDELGAGARRHVWPEDSDYDRAALLRRMARTFDLTELHDLAFQLDIEAGELSGDTFNAQARALIGIIERRGRLAELVALCREMRPAGGF